MGRGETGGGRGGERTGGEGDVSKCSPLSCECSAEVLMFLHLW